MSIFMAQLMLDARCCSWVVVLMKKLAEGTRIRSGFVLDRLESVDDIATKLHFWMFVCIENVLTKYDSM